MSDKPETAPQEVVTAKKKRGRPPGKMTGPPRERLSGKVKAAIIAVIEEGLMPSAAIKAAMCTDAQYRRAVNSKAGRLYIENLTKQVDAAHKMRAPVYRAKAYEIAWGIANDADLAPGVRMRAVEFLSSPRAEKILEGDTSGGVTINMGPQAGYAYARPTAPVIDVTPDDDD